MIVMHVHDADNYNIRNHSQYIHILYRCYNVIKDTALYYLLFIIYYLLFRTAYYSFVRLS